MTPRLSALLALTVLAFASWASAAPAPPKPSPCAVVPGSPRPAGCAPWSGARTAAQEPKGKANAGAPKLPSFEEQDLRARRIERQSRTLLLRELGRLEQLFRSTPEKSPERARIVLRLADTFAELARLSEIEELEAAERARKAARDAQKAVRARKAAPSQAK
jgi:hypothetical protein